MPDSGNETTVPTSSSPSPLSVRFLGTNYTVRVCVCQGRSQDCQWEYVRPPRSPLSCEVWKVEWKVEGSVSRLPQGLFSVLFR